MSRIGWHRLTFAVGALLLAFLGYQSYQFYQAAEQQRAEYKYQPARSPGFRIGVPSQAPTPHYKPSCNNPYEREDADLCAQWAAVDQVTEANRLTSLSARLAAITFFLTAVGTAALLWTLRETRVVSRSELRAYVNCDLSGISDGTHNPERPLAEGLISAIWAIKNTGQTPAYDLAHWGELALCEIDKQETLQPVRPLPRRHRSALPPGARQSKMMHIPKKPTKRQIAAIKKGTLGVFIYGRIEYRDVFGDEHWDEYRLHYVGDWPPAEGALLFFAAEGNQSDQNSS